MRQLGLLSGLQLPMESSFHLSKIVILLNFPLLGNWHISSGPGNVVEFRLRKTSQNDLLIIQSSAWFFQQQTRAPLLLGGAEVSQRREGREGGFTEISRSGLTQVFWWGERVRMANNTILGFRIGGQTAGVLQCKLPFNVFYSIADKPFRKFLQWSITWPAICISPWAIVSWKKMLYWQRRSGNKDVCHTELCRRLHSHSKENHSSMRSWIPYL